ncbi:hypothetical protein R6Q59_017979 [Mikania micrantha]
MAKSIKIEKQSSKAIKPFVQTPQTLTHFKLGFIDEFAPDVNVGVVLFFSTNTNQTTNFIERLEKSLEKTLTRFYPLAGRLYVDKTATINCNDHGVEFIHAKVNIKLQDFLVSEANVKFIDDFIPSKIGVVLQQSDPLLAIQVTTFECGGVAIGVKATHKIVDASTLSTLINEWAVTNRQENDNDNDNIFTGSNFISSLLFPPRGLCPMPVPPMNKDELNKYTRKKLSFSESVISNMKAKGSKVQLISAIIWKAFMGVDIAIHNHQRESMLIQAVNLRGKMASLIPKTSCGNLFGTCTTECRTHETIEEVTDRLSDSVRKCITNFSKVHHDCEEGQTMVLKSLLSLTNIRESTCGVIVTSWCKFPFYQVDFGFGKPIWAAPGTIPINQSAYLMDDVQGNGVEAYVFQFSKLKTSLTLKKP